MPIHEWTRVDAGLFHDFHQDWMVEFCRSLNAGRLPPGYVALAEGPAMNRYRIFDLRRDYGETDRAAGPGVSIERPA